MSGTVRNVLRLCLVQGLCKHRLVCIQTGFCCWRPGHGNSPRSCALLYIWKAASLHTHAAQGVVEHAWSMQECAWLYAQPIVQCSRRQRLCSLEEAFEAMRTPRQRFETALEEMAGDDMCATAVAPLGRGHLTCIGRLLFYCGRYSHEFTPKLCLLRKHWMMDERQIYLVADSAGYGQENGLQEAVDELRRYNLLVVCQSCSASEQEQWPTFESLVPHGRTFAKHLTPEVMHSVGLTDKEHAEIGSGYMILLLARLDTSGAIVTSILALQ